MSISEALAYSRRRHHDHVIGKVSAMPDGVRLDDAIEVRLSVSLCNICGHLMLALGLYVDGKQMSLTNWIASGDASIAAWHARQA
jgi:hypothetical protein